MSGLHLYTPAEASRVLQVRESWLRKKAAARVIPCTFVGRHLRFSEGDLEEIIRSGSRQPVTGRRRPPARRGRGL
ncbi:helix-turn-helix domain-containing protein [Actinomadura sp. KC216]|uniref:helix-turn-helix domain-containing protein n=1 Tax=Actinomadura sp. KC216 TaxID=2530370 RepID=UPI001FB7EFEF|nr:helix-turn-helix domain-containing protein [Actinomadura sp. KC216]